MPPRRSRGNHGAAAPQVIERFASAYPRARFRILDLSANDCLESVGRNEAEFGINFIGATETDLTLTPLLDDPFVLACHRKHRLATKDEIEWSDLEDESLVGISKISGNRQTLEAALIRTAVKLPFRYEVNHLTTSLGLVERGLGVSALPRLATPAGEHTSIAARPLRNPTVQRTIGIIERRSPRLPSLTQRFRDMLLSDFRQSTKVDIAGYRRHSRRGL